MTRDGMLGIAMAAGFGMVFWAVERAKAGRRRRR